MLWLFYAIFSEDAILLITINTFAFFMEFGYITVYLLYATKKDKVVYLLSPDLLFLKTLLTLLA